MPLVLPTARIYHGANSLSAVYTGSHKAWEPAVVSPYLFSEDWNTADDTHWDFYKWPHQRPYYTINAGRGFSATGGSPTQVYADQYVSDFEMSVKMTWPSSIGGQYPEIAWRIYSNMASSVGSGYAIQVNGSGNGIDLFRVGGYTSIANASDASLFAAGTRWFKIRVVGHNHKVRWWDEAGVEPGTWQIDVTDASPQTDSSGVAVTGGGIGFRYYGATQIWYDDLTVTNLGSDLGPDGSMRMLSNAKVNVNGNTNIFPTDTDLTWCCWIKTTSYAGGIGTAIISLFDNVGGYCITSVGTNGVLQQYMNPTGDFTTGYSFPLNTWVFVAMSRSITGGTDVYYAPEGTPTLTKTHNASIGVITNNPLRLLSDEFGGGPYSMGAAFKVWKAALSQAELTTEMATYSAVRTANLFGSWPMKTGLSPYSENPVDNALLLTYETGAIVSGPKAPAA